MKKDSNSDFRSASFPLVTFLFAKGEQVAGINPTDNPSKKEFSFVSSPRLEELVYLYKFGERNDPDLLVQVHIYEQARRELLDGLNN
ncbi:MAG: hypothetical protein Q8R36_01480 [bacterium]|nr:hypothetical protein [bacterium]